MAGTLTLKRHIGSAAGDERTAISNGFVHFSTLDSAEADAGFFPIGQPTDASTSYSMEVWLKLKMTKAPANKIDNIRFWSSGSEPDTGIFMYIGSADSGVTPVITKSIVAVTTASQYSDAVSSYVWTERQFTEVDSVSSFLVMQEEIDSSVGVGNHASENAIYHYSYDES